MTWASVSRRVRLYAGGNGYVDAEWIRTGLHVRYADVSDSDSMGAAFEVTDGAALLVHLFRERFEGVETLQRAHAFAERHRLVLSSVEGQPPEGEERIFVGVEGIDLVHLACLEREVRLYRNEMMDSQPKETWVIPEPVFFLFALLLERYEGAAAFSRLRRDVDEAGLAAKDEPASY